VTVKGIDIASYQGLNFPFAKARQQGFEFVVIKAAGGHTYMNPYREQQVAAARTADMVIGWYFYQFEPSSGGGDVEREFANLRAALDGLWRPGETIWLDVEEYPATVGLSNADLGDWIVRFGDLVAAEYGITMGIYCATWYLQPTGLTNDTRLAKYPFWMASWQDALPAKSAMRPWDRVTLWQYNATYTGVTGAHLDCNEFQGSREELIALGTPGRTVSEHKEDVGDDPAGFLHPGDADVFSWPGAAGVIVARTSRWYNPHEGKYYDLAWNHQDGYLPAVEVQP
jgi:GH25 family lysozyme M1 (1,4-beta-N-acetylmuramidase)